MRAVGVRPLTHFLELRLNFIDFNSICIFIDYEEL
jgi:hypothetical protein